jgi:hypothetical protein
LRGRGVSSFDLRVCGEEFRNLEFTPGGLAGAEGAFGGLGSLVQQELVSCTHYLPGHLAH